MKKIKSEIIKFIRGGGQSHHNARNKICATLAIILSLSTPMQALAIDKSVEFYEANAKLGSLGNYEFTVEAHEMPSNEVLPIIDKSYFPVTTKTLYTEIDNTAPGATYEAKPATKVDIIFAFGNTTQSTAMQNLIKTLEARVAEGENINVDVYAEKVETSTIDITSQDPSKLLSTWEKWKQYERDPITTWSYISSDKSIQDNDYHCHRQGFVDRSHSTKGNFELSADIVGYSHRYNDYYGVTFRHGDDHSHYAVVYQDVHGSGCGMYSGQLPTGISLVKADGVNSGVTVASNPCSAWTQGTYWNLKVTMTGNTIKVFLNNNNVITYTDNSPLTDGNYGIVSVSHGSGRFKNIQLTSGSQKSLGEAVSDVHWRDGSMKFIVYAEDTIPEYMKNLNSADYVYTVSKLIGSNANLINLGTSTNQTVLQQLVRDISTASETKGTFFLNSNISQAMNNAADWIIDKIRNLSKPTNWILVNTEVDWFTQYTDYERDVPLNFGEHDGTKNKDKADEKLSQSWGVAMTHLFKEDKIHAEKWRYRHFNLYYDNSPVQEGFHNNWISEPVEIFPYPGKYRINYKRKDNPFHTDVNLEHLFKEYRKWSDNYDPLLPFG